ncbi:MAG: DUF302 domain-containing protein [Bacteroidales bacterium]|jgi:uncharacterized protein (DUF302 family)|nr:DUF302 domain-containing protein [Bacteroidales bacterium]
MKPMIIGILIGLVIGIIITALVLFYSSPSIMLSENKSNYDFETTVQEFEKSVVAHDWKIPHVNNLQETMKNFDLEVNKVKVYEICQPNHAYNILSQDDERIVASLMPCRVAIYEKSDGSVFVSRMNSGTLAKPMNKIIRSTMSVAAAETEAILKPIIN